MAVMTPGCLPCVVLGDFSLQPWIQGIPETLPYGGSMMEAGTPPTLCLNKGSLNLSEKLLRPDKTQASNLLGVMDHFDNLMKTC